MAIVKRSDRGGTLLVACADMHSNSTTGLNPPIITLDNGQTVHQSVAQKRDLWDPWLACREHIKTLKRRLGCRVVVLFNGDGPDLLKYCHHELVTVNRATIVRTAVETLTPLREIADVFLVNRGTQAHEGGSGELSELVAERLDATKCPHTGLFSWWWVTTSLENVRIEAGHRPISNSTRAHLRGAGARRTAAERTAAYLNNGDLCPDIGIFSHVHHFADSGTNYTMRVFYTFPWQLCTAYGYNIGFGGKQDQVGMWLFHCRNGQYTVDKWTHRPEPIPFYKL